METREFLSVHDAHCCRIHGCKYGDPGCPVTNGEELGIECEDCVEEKNAPLSYREIRAKEFIEQWGGVDGGHHKQWVLDQVMRILLDKDYDSWLDEYNNEVDDEGELLGEWDQGIAP
jgi:hypothetical protein